MIFLLLIVNVLADNHPFVTPFGTDLGSNNGVPGYSNGNSYYTSASSSYYGWIFAGLKWQCVEYARRWLIISHDLTFASIPCASDIWHLSTLESTEYYPFTYSVPFNRVPNGSKCAPIQGSVLIYKRVDVENPVGHVAIITEVGKDFILVSEQNWDNDFWPGNYSRKVPLDVTDGVYTIKDELPILGWMVYQDYDKSCFDSQCKTCTPANHDSEIGCNYA